MTDKPSAPLSLPSWLQDLGLAELSLLSSSVVAGGDLICSITVRSGAFETMPALLQLTEEGAVVAEWPITVPTERVTVTIPNELQPGTYELVIRRDSWELDAVPVILETPGDVERSKTYESALSSSEKFMDALRERKLEEAYGYAQAAASAYTSLGSPIAAARVLRECASALFSGGNSALASTAAFRALELYRDADDEKSAESAKHLLTRALRHVETLGDRPREQIVGDSPPLLDALGKVEQIGPTDATVLIMGETGSGKELFARALHNRSSRSDRPLITVNLAAIPPGLVESALFGHVSGALTGTVRDAQGRLEMADGGTVFLDEIDELPLGAQVELLRVLQEGKFEAVGGSRTVKVDVRLIAATNRDLRQAVRDGKFREDFFYRLCVFPIEVPPLRQRKSDIGILAEFFLARFSQSLESI